MKYWLKIPVKVREQIVRAGRLFAVTLVGGLVALDGKHITGSVIVGVIVAAAETVFRQLVPVTPQKPTQIAVQPPAAPEAGYAGNELLIGLAAIVIIVAGIVYILNATH